MQTQEQSPALAVALWPEKVNRALLSIGLYTTPFHHPQQMSIDVPYWAGLPSEQRNPIVSYAFWFVGTPLAFIASIIASSPMRRPQRMAFTT